MSSIFIIWWNLFDFLSSIKNIRYQNKQVNLFTQIIYLKLECEGEIAKT